MTATNTWRHWRLKTAIFASLVCVARVCAAETTVGIEDTANVSSAALAQFEQTIAQLEYEQGAFGADLPEQLLSLGALLQQLNRHQEAAELLKRGVHVARINGGLYSAAQIPLLRQQIQSLRAMGEYAAVDERQRYLYRVERRALGNGLASINALLRQGEWQRDAFLLQLDADELAPQRLDIMWDVYRLALNQLIGLYGKQKPQLEPALEGMLTSQYLMAGYRGRDGLDNSRDLRLSAYSNEAYKRGKSVLRALMDLHAANNGDDPLVRMRDLQRLGDWSWWFGNARQAMKPYREAWDLAMATDDTGALAEALFALPVPLPDVKGVAPIPEPDEGDAGALVLSFSVTRGGRIRDLERLRSPEVEEDEQAVSRLERLVRTTRFRPRMVQGEPVSTDGMVWSFNENDWQYLK